MNILFLTIPVTLALVGGFLAAFFWATKSGQWDDLDTPSTKILRESPTTEGIEAIETAEVTGAIETTGKTKKAGKEDP
ncbi:MAG: cbb3-type cytochrome oxidase assembly protein CcoS [Bdellovibrio sp.]|nr:MAG: cbb3-type cytochrome oxidase assembly protein CcoS [Bdellovibrio sp.]